MLCGNEIKENEAALDHDHITGKIRGVLHISCNAAEGRIMNLITRTKCPNDIEHKLEFLLMMINYISKEYSDVLHPSFKSENEIKRLKLKRKLKKLKQKNAIQKTKTLIKELTSAIEREYN